MTHLQFQRWLEKLEIPDAVVDYRYNRDKKRFEIIVTSKIGEHYQTQATYFRDEWLNDTRMTNRIMEEFVPKTIKALNAAKKKFN